MIIKYDYVFENGETKRKVDYTFTPYEDLEERLNGIDNEDVINSIINITLKGEAEREIIGIEDKWFKVQSQIQEADKKRTKLEALLENGRNGEPLNENEQLSIKAQIAELSEGTMTIEKEFYNHYTRETYKVTENVQTPYTILLEQRTDIEDQYPFLKAYRGVEVEEKRPEPFLSEDKEKAIRKLFVRQQIDIEIGDIKDLFADAANALKVLIKKVNNEAVSDKEETYISKFLERQKNIEAILEKDYV